MNSQGLGTRAGAHRRWAGGLGLVAVALVIAWPASAQTTGAPRPAQGTTPAAAQAPTLDLTAVSLPIPPAGRLVAITNATIMTASRGTIPKGTILIRDGKIAAVGADVQVPAGANVIDAYGKYVTPGIIDAHSHAAS